MKKKVNPSKKVNTHKPITNRRQTRVNKRTPKPNKKQETHKYKIKPSKKKYTKSEKKIITKRALVMIITVLVLALIVFIAFGIFNTYRSNNLFAQEAEVLQEEYENPIFKVNKIYLYSDANVEDLSENQDLSNINVSQYTDFVIYINNLESSDELTEENTVNNIYIDNISITRN